MARTPLALSLFLTAVCTVFGTPVRTLSVDLASPAKPISPSLFGVFFEDLNYAADGGIYAELIQNRSFEYSATEQASWGPTSFWEMVKTGEGEGHLSVANSRPVHVNNPHYVVLNVTKPGDGVGLGNRGFDQIPLEAGKRYEASFWAYQAYMGIKWSEGDQSRPMPLTVRHEGDGGAVLAEAKFTISGRAWTKHTATLTPTRDAQAARLVLLAHEQGGVALDMISLFPHDTFKGRANGLRRDLAQTIADLKPRFVRFPGGCLVHGAGVHAYYDWKDTVGPVEQRVAARNSWGYHQTMGLGYFEYFQFCEDLGALPVPVVTAGVCCQHSGDSPGRGQEGLPMEEMPGYVQDVLDLIEWANGPADSKWGAVRAAAGHPEPFGLKYLGVGNEDAITPDFKERFAMINEVLKEKHPEIVVIGTSGPFPDGEDFDLGWAFARELKLAMVDEHYYRPPDWFWENLERYDSYDRDGPTVYVGEYAAHESDRRNTLRTALAEAAFLTSLERNGDVVLLSSYAPLLARRQHTQWHPDMIYFNATEVFPSLNYTVQRLFGENAGDAYITTRFEGASLGGARLAASTVRDNATGELVLKIVNGENTPQTIVTQFTGAAGLATSAQRIVFAGNSADLVNVDGQPAVVQPKVETVSVSPKFEYMAPAHSFTIFRLRPQR